jgi:plasmid maintenance system antidote protein VapI
VVDSIVKVLDAVVGDSLRLGRLLKTSPQLWMRLQADWDLFQAMEREARKAS